MIFEKKITIYEQQGEDFIDLFSGTKDNIPSHLMNSKVKVIGAKERSHIDIEIERGDK